VRGVGGWRSVPWFGGLWQFFNDRIGFFENCARSGDAITTRLGPIRVVVFSHPEYVREVFVAEGKHFTRGITGAPMRAFLGNGLLLSEGETWRRQRKDLQPIFSPERIATWTNSIEQSTLALVSRWRDGDRRDIHHEMHRLTLDISARLFLGVASDEGGHMHDALEAISSGDVFEPLIPVGPIHWPVRPSRAARALNALVDHQIATASDGTFIAAVGAVSRDRRELRDQLVTLLFTAQDTTAVALTWLWHLLSRNPAARAEFEASRAHLERVVSETLRLYPPVVAQARQAIDECAIGDVRVRRGDLVMFSQWVIQRDARWFAEPIAFRPERWADGLEQRLHPFAFFPFGGGRRVCLGRQLASTIALTVVPLIAHRYRLVATMATEPDIDAVISPRPRRGLPMTIRLN
jgi:cytochrome P450